VFFIKTFYSSVGSCVAVDRRSVVTTCRLIQNLAQSAIVGRWKYGELLKGNSGVLVVTRFSDEAHLQVDGYVNNYNGPFSTTYNPTLTVAKLLHSDIFAVYNALPSVPRFGPVFIDDTVICDVYHSLLHDEFVPLLMRYSIPVNVALFQKDCTRTHTSNVVYFSLHDVYGDSPVESVSSAIWVRISWLPTSPEINRCNSFLWSCIKDRVFMKNLYTIPEL
jgi:hypothetical protein